MHLCVTGESHSFSPVGGDMVPLPCKLGKVIVVEYEAVSRANAGKGILEAKVAHCFHWIRLPQLWIHEWSAVAVQLGYDRVESFVLCTRGNQQVTPLELLSVVGICIHEMEQRMTHTGLSAHS